MTLRQAAYLISNSSLVISNDSMPAHMAIATYRPLMCLHSGARFGRYFPYPYRIPKVKVIMYDWDCFGSLWDCDEPLEIVNAAPNIGRISVDVVKDQVKALL